MTFEKFSKYLEMFLEQHKKQETWLDKLNEVFPNAWEAFYEHDFQTLFIQMFTEAMNDKDGWIAYFVYECNCKWFDVYVRDNEGTTQEVERVVRIDTPRALYDLIVGY